jgi:hypothetical protein
MKKPILHLKGKKASGTFRLDFCDENGTMVLPSVMESSP